MLIYPQSQELYPIGSVIESNSPPNNKWERCYGQIVLQSDYPKLFPIMENPHPMRYSNWAIHSGTVTGTLSAYWSSDVIYGGTRWVCAGSGGAINYSSDLINWTCIKPFGTSIYLYCLAFNGTTFCSVPGSPSSNTSYTSTDGVNWTANAGVLPVTGYWTDITWDGTYFLAVASGYAGIVRSLDGVTWAVAIATVPYCTTGIGFQSIASDGNGMVVVSSAGNKLMAYSTDHGSTWNSTFICPYSDVLNMSYENGKFLAAMEYQTNGYSDDGIDWKFKNGPWFYYGAPYYQNPVRAYESDDIYRWKYFNGTYFGITWMNRMVYSTDFVEFRQHIFSPDEDLTLDAIAYDSVNDRIFGYSSGEVDVYELTCAYDMDTYFQFPMSVGDLRYDYGKHRYIRVR